MRHNEIVRSVAWISKTKMKDIAESLGVSYGTLANSLSAGGAPSVTRFTDCVEACGYKVVVMPEDCEIPQYSFRVDGSGKGE